MIDIKNVNKAKVLAALYNNSRPLGMDWLHAKAEPMTEKMAAKILEQDTYFDYLQGCVMKVDLSGNTFEERLYDRDNGQGAAYAAIKDLLQSA